MNEIKDSRWLKYDKFQERLSSLIESKGVLGKDLAYGIESTPATISRYLTQNRDPELEYVYRIAKYFDVTIDWLLGISDDKQEIYTAEAKHISELYSKASVDDQAVVKTVLRKYED